MSHEIENRKLDALMPFQPEPIDALKARFPAALITVYEVEACESGRQQPPGLQRPHVFDFSDGVRMIVSREKHHQTVLIHASFGVHHSFAPRFTRGYSPYASAISAIFFSIRSPLNASTRNAPPTSGSSTPTTQPNPPTPNDL